MSSATGTDAASSSAPSSASGSVTTIGNLSATTATYATNVNTTLVLSKSTLLALVTSVNGSALTLTSAQLNSGNASLTDAGGAYDFLSSNLGSYVLNYIVSASDGSSIHNTVAINVIAAGLATAPSYVSNDNGQLYSFNPASGTATLVSTTTWMGQAISFGDIAINSDGQLYGVNYPASGVTDGIYSINPTTGLATLAAQYPVSSEGVYGLTFLSNGYIVLAGDSVSVGPVGGPYVTLVPSTSDYSTSGDIVALPDGYLYWTVRANAGQCQGSGDVLVRVQPSTGATTNVGCIGYDDVFGLGYANGMFYGFDYAGDVFQISTVTGAGSSPMSIGSDWLGATTNPVVW